MQAAATQKGGLDYQTAKRVARYGKTEERCALAARDDTPPEILFFLAADAAEMVRRELANNGRTPGKVDLLLAGDRDLEVRSSLARKAVERVPGNTAANPGQLEKLTLEVLSALSRDGATDVRRILSDALNDLKHAPKSVIKTLAWDKEIEVAGPVLERSPVLEDGELVEIVQGSKAKGAAGAVAGRRMVSEMVADAVVRTDDAAAIATLLANDSAQIREETLDRILDQAPAQESWHRPLVSRPSLPGGAARRLARFVALSLVEILQSRPDLDPEAAHDVAGLLRHRLENRNDGGAAEPAPAARAQAVNEERDKARRLVKDGQVTEYMIDEAIFDGRRDFVEACLAAMAKVDDQVVAHILQSRAARGVVALAWKAQVSMRLAMKIQLQLARIPPKSVIHPASGDKFPMTREEMIWQLEFFGAA